MEIMSFGGGIQTVAMALMCLNGDLPMPDHSIFADPGWEVEATYEYLSWFIPYCENKGMSFHVVSGGNLKEDALDMKKKRWTTMPMFTLNKQNQQGMLQRQCTSEYKIMPVYRKVRDLLGLKPYQKTKDPANVWLGISIDEVSRMKPSRVGYVKNCFPLIEKGISRFRCIKYIEDQGLPMPPKSACIGCPYHSNIFWQQLRENAPEDFADACQFDMDVRKALRKSDQSVFVHKSCKPLSEIDFTQGQIDLFDNECEGYCGL